MMSGAENVFNLSDLAHANNSDVRYDNVPTASNTSSLVRRFSNEGNSPAEPPIIWESEIHESHGNCQKCALLQKKLRISRGWNRFFKEKLINIDKILHIISDYEQEKQKNLELQLAYDQRSREWAQQQEQLISLLNEVQPLREQVKQAEKTASEEMNRRMKHQYKEESFIVANQQLQAKLTNLSSITNPTFVENLKRKLKNSQSEGRKLRSDVAFCKNEIEELRSNVSSKRLHIDNLSKKLHFALRLVRNLTESPSRNAVDSKNLEMVDSIYEENEQYLESRYTSYKSIEAGKLQGLNLKSFGVPSFSNWISDFNMVDSSSEENHDEVGCKLEKLLTTDSVLNDQFHPNVQEFDSDVDSVSRGSNNDEVLDSKLKFKQQAKPVNKEGLTKVIGEKFSKQIFQSTPKKSSNDSPKKSFDKKQLLSPHQKTLPKKLKSSAKVVEESLFIKTDVTNISSSDISSRDKKLHRTAEVQLSPLQMPPLTNTVNVNNFKCKKTPKNSSSHSSSTASLVTVESVSDKNKTIKSSHINNSNITSRRITRSLTKNNQQTSSRTQKGIFSSDSEIENTKESIGRNCASSKLLNLSQPSEDFESEKQTRDSLSGKSSKKNSASMKTAECSTSFIKHKKLTEKSVEDRNIDGNVSDIKKLNSSELKQTKKSSKPNNDEKIVSDNPVSNKSKGVSHIQNIISSPVTNRDSIDNLQQEEEDRKKIKKILIDLTINPLKFYTLYSFSSEDEDSSSSSSGLSSCFKRKYSQRSKIQRKKFNKVPKNLCTPSTNDEVLPSTSSQTTEVKVNPVLSNLLDSDSGEEFSPRRKRKYSTVITSDDEDVKDVTSRLSTKTKKIHFESEKQNLKSFVNKEDLSVNTTIVSTSSNLRKSALFGSDLSLTSSSDEEEDSKKLSNKSESYASDSNSNDSIATANERKSLVQSDMVNSNCIPIGEIDSEESDLAGEKLDQINRKHEKEILYAEHSIEPHKDKSDSGINKVQLKGDAVVEESPRSIINTKNQDNESDQQTDSKRTGSDSQSSDLKIISHSVENLTMLHESKSYKNRTSITPTEGGSFKLREESVSHVASMEKQSLTVEDRHSPSETLESMLISTHDNQILNVRERHSTSETIKTKLISTCDSASEKLESELISAHDEQTLNVKGEDLPSETLESELISTHYKQTLNVKHSSSEVLETKLISTYDPPSETLESELISAHDEQTLNVKDKHSSSEALETKLISTYDPPSEILESEIISTHDEQALPVKDGHLPSETLESELISTHNEQTSNVKDKCLPSERLESKLISTHDEQTLPEEDRHLPSETLESDLISAQSKQILDFNDKHMPSEMLETKLISTYDEQTLSVKDNNLPSETLENKLISTLDEAKEKTGKSRAISLFYDSDSDHEMDDNYSDHAPSLASSCESLEISYYSSDENLKEEDEDSEASSLIMDVSIDESKPTATTDQIFHSLSSPKYCKTEDEYEHYLGSRNSRSDDLTKNITNDDPSLNNFQATSSQGIFVSPQLPQSLISARVTNIQPSSSFLPSFYKEREDTDNDGAVSGIFEDIFVDHSVSCEEISKDNEKNPVQEKEEVKTEVTKVNRQYMFEGEKISPIASDVMNSDHLLELFQDAVRILSSNKADFLSLMDQIADYLQSGFQAPNIFTRLQPLVRVVVICILRCSPYEKVEVGSPLPPTLFKLFRITRGLEKRFQLKPYCVESLVSTTAHKILLSRKLRANSLTSLTTWVISSCSTQFNSLPFPLNQDCLHWSRSFLLDLLFHHKGKVHEAILSAVRVSRRLFLRNVSYRKWTVVERMLHWIVTFGRWDGPKAIKNELVTTFERKLGLKSADESLLREILKDILLALCCSDTKTDEMVVAKIGFQLMIRWCSPSQITNHFFITLKVVYYEEKMSATKVPLQALKQYFESVLLQVFWSKKETKKFLRSLEAFPIIIQKS